MSERAGGDISNNNSAHPANRTARERNGGLRQPEEGHTRLKVKVYIFYVDNGMVASTNPRWIHTAFDTLMGLFDWVGLERNVQKTVGMV